MSSPGTASWHRPTAITRRTFLGAVMAASGAGLAGCATPIGSGFTGSEVAPGTVKYWNLFGGGDGVRMLQMLEGFRKANRTIGLEAVTFAWGNPYYTKLSLATLGEQPPDVAISHLTRMRTLVRADLLQ